MQRHLARVWPDLKLRIPLQSDFLVLLVNGNRERALLEE